MTTKQAQALTTTTKTKNTIFILIKKIKGRLCCCGFLCKTDHWRPSWVKRAKRKRRFLHFWTTISNFTDTVLMGLDSMDADLKNRPNDVTNPFDFDKWWSTAGRTSKSTTSTKKYLEIVQYKSGLHHSKQLSSLKTADINSTISMVASTGNAPQNLRVHKLYATSLQMRYILI